MADIKLSKEATDAGYILAEQPPMDEAIFGKFGHVKFSELTAARAKSLVKRKFKYIALSETKGAVAKADAKQVDPKADKK